MRRTLTDRGPRDWRVDRDGQPDDALGVVFTGAFTAIGTSLYAACAAKKKKQSEDK